MEIVQSPGVVVIVNEMVHNARVIPTDGRPHTTLRQWSGDSRGRWDGETLVVETINFRRETSLQGSTANTRLVERFTKVDAETIKYEFTVTDPTAYTRPWTAMMPLTRIREPLFDTPATRATTRCEIYSPVRASRRRRRASRVGRWAPLWPAARQSLPRPAVTLHFATRTKPLARRPTGSGVIRRT